MTKGKKHIAALFYIVLQIFLVLGLIKDSWTIMAVSACSLWKSPFILEKEQE